MEPDTFESQNEPNPVAEAEKEAQIAIAQQMIASTLSLSLGIFSGVTLQNQYIEEASQAYAVLIIKYFPGGIFGLLDRYKEEIAAGTTTIMLIRAVSQAKAQQEKEQAEAEEKKPNSETGPFQFGEQSAESSNKVAGGFANG